MIGTSILTNTWLTRKATLNLKLMVLPAKRVAEKKAQREEGTHTTQKQKPSKQQREA